jgi:excisionase family DNA binding protein
MNLMDVEKICLEQTITTQEASKILGVSRKRVNDLCNKGKLIARQAGAAWLISRLSVEQRKAQNGKLSKDHSNA